MSLSHYLENYIVNPILCMSVWLESVKLQLGPLCVQFDHPYPSLYYMTGVWWETPPSLTLAGIIGLLIPVRCHNSSVTWIVIAIDLWQSDQFSLINTIHFNISLLLGCHSASFRLGPLAARSCFPTWAFWPPGNWSNLSSDYHKNHLI
jgi:hypothetical protein